MRTRKEDANGVPGRTLEADRGLLVAALVGAAYLLWTLLGPQNPVLRKQVSDLVSPAIALVAAVWSVWGLAARRRASTKGLYGGAQGRWSANFLTFSIMGYGVGSALWAYYELALHQQPFPSWADAAYLTGTTSMMIGVLLLPGRRMPALMRMRALLDSMMIMAALITFSWFFLLGPTVLNAEGTLLSKSLGAAYPCIDLAMLFCVMVMAARSQEPSIVRVRNLAVAAVLAYVAADVPFLYLTLKGTYQAGSPFDVGWMVANLLTCQAAFALRKLSAAPSESSTALIDAQCAPQLWRSLAPYALIPAVGLLLAYTWKTQVHGGLALGVQVGSGALVGLVMFRQVFAIVENSRLNRFLQAAYRELEDLATTDGMTGLPNHRVFQERLRKEMAASEESGAALSLLLIDVDRFKAYNDGFGHPAGDEALRLVARLIRENVRDADLPARYGGEEFAAILPQTDMDAAMVVAERIRAASEAQAYPHRAVTLSIGVSTCVGGEPGTLIEEADRALYAAKHGGRNQVATAARRLHLIDRDADSEATLPSGWSLHRTREVGIERLASPSQETIQGPVGPLIRAMLAMLSLRDHDVERHSDRVMRYCLRLAQAADACGAASVSPSAMADLHLGALLHDIGKVGVPDAILHKPGALTPEEWEIVRRHPIEGASLLADIPELAGAMPVVRSHHERWDGTGYPDGLVRGSIPLGARLFALADTLDAMWSDRPYRAAMPFSAIRDEVRRMAGSQFDPALVEAFLNVPQSEWEDVRGEKEALPRAA